MDVYKIREKASEKLRTTLYWQSKSVQFINQISSVDMFAPVNGFVMTLYLPEMERIVSKRGKRAIKKKTRHESDCSHIPSFNDVMQQRKRKLW